MHADLKMENVMFVNHQQEPYKVKVIDLGLACHMSAAKTGSYIQTCPYRSPEVILGLPLTGALDMCSLGCMAAFLYLSTLLYPGMYGYDMMRYIVDIQGKPPDLLNLGCKTNIFFERDCITSSWKLKTPERVRHETRIQPMETRRLKLRFLDAVLRHKRITHEDYADSAAKMNDVLLFVDMLKTMLELDAENFHPSKKVKRRCYASPANASSSQDPMDLSHPVPHQRVIAHPSKNSQTQNWIRSDVKKASVEGVRCRDVTIDHYRRLYYERMRDGKSSAGPSTSGSSTQTQTCTSPQTSQLGLKRKAADGEDVQPRKRSSVQFTSVQQSASLQQSLSP
uniref:homeodomain-interacting protein kinase 2-like n=1 Tax=Monopterus albus TaxID=43700 RepID=UPI0009B3E8BE|nr:homeodomain-interacting protein kinase 2-like [Monopterus albus]XP_020442006.1 homeodomain-interacting protein kinase 2-like [Monopterus albus]